MNYTFNIVEDVINKSECLNYCGYVCGNQAEFLGFLQSVIIFLIFMILSFTVTKAVKIKRNLK